MSVISHARHDRRLSHHSHSLVLYTFQVFLNVCNLLGSFGQSSLEKERTLECCEQGQETQSAVSGGTRMRMNHASRRM
jgi:hypothetical protein